MKTKNILNALSIFFAACIITGCSDDDQDNYIPAKQGIQVRTDNEFGKVLTTPEGKTLYFFAPDVNGSANCNGQCAITWPAYYSENAAAVAGIDPKDIGVITGQGGKKQNTYKGWPLYQFSNDSQVNDIKGDAVNGTWFVAKPDYILMIANAQLVGADGKNYKEDLSEGNGITPYFTNGAGRTVYSFTQDTFNKNNFTKEDFSNDAVWPIYQSEAGPTPSVIKKDLLGSITVFGKKQLTYNGRPLYYYGQDTKRGDTKGVSVPRPGVWPYVNLETSRAAGQ